MAASGVVPVLRRAAAAGCVDLRLTVDDTTSGATALAAGRADVWVPDSRARAQLLGVPTAQDAPSLGLSPVVLTVPRSAIGRLATHDRASWTALLGPQRLPSATDIQNTGTSSAGLQVAALLSRLAGDRLHEPDAGPAAAAAALSVPVTARAAYTGRTIRVAEARLVRRTPGALILPTIEGDPTLDYPAVPSTTLTATARKALVRLTAAALGAPGTDGRHVAGLLEPSATSYAVTAHAPATRLLTGVTVGRAAAAVIATARHPGNALVLVDVSGSMTYRSSTSGPPAGVLARRAAAAAVRHLPGGSRVGLWEFGYRVSGDSDHRTVVSLRALSSGRQTLIDRSGQLRTRYTGTSLNSSVLAAYTDLLAHYRRGAANTVVVITDGREQDAPGRPDGAQLRRSLTAVRDVHRPVSVVFLAVGKPDMSAMRRITRVTGGDVRTITQPAQAGSALVRSASPTRVVSARP